MVKQIGGVMQAIAKGDFSQRVTGQFSGDLSVPMTGNFQGDLARLQNDLNQSMQNLAGLVTEVMSAAGDMRVLTHAISDANQQVSHQMQIQTAEMAQTTASVQQVTSTVKESAVRAVSANNITATAQAQAAKGEQTMKTAIVAMAAVRESSQRVADIVGLIDGIASFLFISLKQ